MREKMEKLLLDQRFLVGAWALQTVWYLCTYILMHNEVMGGLTQLFLAVNIALAYLVPIYTLAFIAFGFVRREGYIRYKAIPVLTFLICYILQTVIYWVIGHVFG